MLVERNFIDKFNPKKIWIVKRYSCGHYYVNQQIAGKVFYRKFQRTTKYHLNDIGVFSMEEINHE